MFRLNVHFPGSGPIALLAALTLAAPLVAHAQTRVRVTPSVTLSQEYDSNVLRREHDEQSDLITQLAPRLSLELDGDRGHARIWAGLTSRFYQDVTELDATDRFLRWDGERQLSSRFSFFSEGRLAYFEDLDPVADEGGDFFGSGRPDEQQVRAVGGVRYALTAGSSLSASFGYLDRDFSSGDTEVRNGRRDSETRWGSLSYGRLLNPRDQILASLMFEESDFSSIGFLASETDRTLSGTFRWSRAWSPRWSTSFSAGLRSLDVDSEDFDDSSIGAVGGAELKRAFQRGELSLSYERETRPTSGLGTTLDIDTFEASYRSRLSERLSLKILGEYYHYRSASDTCVGVGCPVEVDDEIDSTALTTSLRLDWRIRKRFFTFVSYRYRDQSSDGARPVGEYDSHRVMLGFRYAHPFELN